MAAAEKDKTEGTAADRHPITPPTMRRMHSGFHDHGLGTDEAVHAYLSALLDRDVESRKDLTEAEGRRAIEDLAEAPHVATPALLRKLRAAFPEEAIGKLPRSTCKDCSDNRGTCSRHPNKSKCQICGNYHSESTMHIDFVGHADVTARLLEVDPAWTYRTFTAEEVHALPPTLQQAGLWIHLTVLGITRPGFGDADGKRGGNAVKEMIGDALRNAAMRFGVALDLWAKGDRDWAQAEKDMASSQGTGSPQSDPDAPPAEVYRGPSTQAIVDELSTIAIEQSTDLAGITAKWRERHGGLTEEALMSLDPWNIAPLLASVKSYIATLPPWQGAPTTEGAPAS